MLRIMQGLLPVPALSVALPARFLETHFSGRTVALGHFAGADPGHGPACPPRSRDRVVEARREIYAVCFFL
jgi:hypothetical protein